MQLAAVVSGKKLPPAKVRRTKRWLADVSARLNRDTVLEYAVYSLFNHGDLRLAASTLTDKGLYGPARSMAISALEELGKFALAIRFLADDLSAPQFVQQIFSHVPKQAWGRLITHLSPHMVHLNRENVAPSFLEFFRNLEANSEKLVQAVTEDQNGLQQVANELAGHTLESWRQEGIYVSIQETEDTLVVQHPRLVTEEQVQTVIQLLSQLDNDADHALFDAVSCLGLSTSELQSTVLTSPESIRLLKSAIDQFAQAAKESGVFRPPQSSAPHGA